MARQVGRPSEQTNSRDKLIFHARALFTVMAYEKVSTRMIAKRADVNASMIRYYFGNKEGLFETMIRETIEPVKQQLQRFSLESDQEGLAQVMRTYYKTMAQTPDFPKLVAQIMNMSPSDIQRALLKKIFNEISKPIENLITEKMRSEKVIREDMNPELCRVSFISLMLFPFLAPRTMHNMHGIKLNETFLNQLVEHNIKVLSHGFLKTENETSSGDNNEN